MTRSFYILLSFLLLGTAIRAQEHPTDNVTAAEKARVKASAGSFYSRLDELKNSSFPQRSQRTTAGHVLFGWPMRATGTYDNIPNYYVISNYWDQTSTLSLVDWSCNGRTYAGHNGTDISLWPFHWRMKDNDNVYAVAAAPGIVIDTTARFFDETCSFTNTPANMVAILHADSSITYYLHLKRRSLKVTIGDMVYEGQPLALIASSGRSTNPHLHFQVEDKDGNDIEPFHATAGGTNCNNMNSDSWWANQKPIWEPEINRVATHSGKPDLYGPDPDASDYFCPDNEHARLKNSFSQGDSIYFAIYAKDMPGDDEVDIQVIDASGDVFLNTTSTNGGSQSTGRYFIWGRKISLLDPSGTWKVLVTYLSKQYVHYFNVGCIDNYTITTFSTGSYGRIAGSSISSTDVVDGNDKVFLQAGSYIDFKPGFESHAGSDMRGRIRPCGFAD
jgi:murein DD-endopeptidase MepM/ murein hydrolase activator NlpD